MSGFFSRDTAREILIVVLGILIAFSLDAWWDRASSKSALREHAGLVLDELRATEEVLESSMGSHRRLLRYAEFIVSRLEAASPNVRVEVPDTTLADLMMQQTADVGTPALESFLDAGGSSLFNAPASRAALRAWPTTIADVIDDQVYLRENFTVPLARYLRSNADLGRSEYNSMMYRGSVFLDDPEMRSGVEFADVSLRPEVELINLLHARIAMEKLTLIALEMVLETNRGLIEVVEDV